MKEYIVHIDGLIKQGDGDVGVVIPEEMCDARTLDGSKVRSHYRQLGFRWASSPDFATRLFWVNGV